MTVRHFACLPLLALAACAGDGTRPPSLAPRAVEARGWAEPSAPPPAPAPSDPTLDVALDRQRAALATNDAAFTAEAHRADERARLAKGDAIGGDRWLAAQNALATLDQRRATTLEVVNELERLALDRAAALEPDYPALAALRATGEAQLEAETGRIAKLQAALPAD